MAMLLLVVAVLAPTTVWTWRIVTDETRFAAAVSSLPRHRLVTRSVRRRAPLVIAPLVDRLLATTLVDRWWRWASIATHRRTRRLTRRVGLVAAAAFATLSTAAGRWRAAAWLVGSMTLASTLRAIF
jgi:hypothetical protein